MIPGFNLTLASLMDAPAHMARAGAEEFLEEAITLYVSLWAFGREATAAAEDVRDGLVEGALGVTGGVQQLAQDHLGAHRAAAERALSPGLFDLMLMPAQFGQEAARASLDHSRAMGALAFALGERLTDPFVHSAIETPFGWPDDAETGEARQPA